MVYGTYYPFLHKLLFDGSYTLLQLRREQRNIQTGTALNLSVGMLVFL